MDENGSVCQVTNYYPFGTPYSDETSTTNADLQPYKYNSKELDRMHGLDTYDYGARQYAPVLCRWDRIDPLCEKYYSVSPYVYCANNPVMMVDPDGRKLVYAQGVSQEFISAFEKTVKFLNDHNCGQIIDKLKARDETIIITETKSGSAFNYKNMTLKWNPHMALATTNGKTLTPAAILNHEGDHALDYVTNSAIHEKNSNTEDAQYKNKEERRVITGSEQDTALALGIIQKGEVTRENHTGYPLQCEDPTKLTDKEKQNNPWLLEDLIVTPNNK